MKFSVNREVINMLELIDRSPVLQRMIWTVIRIGGVVSLLHAGMPFLIRWWT